MGESNTPPSLHRYLYAYGNPVFYIDQNGNAATPAYSQPLTDQSFQIPPIGTIDTGSQVVDDALATVASVSNLAATMVNGALNTLSLPSRAGGALTGQTAAQFDNQVGGLINSTGPAAPILNTLSAPLRGVGRFSKAAAVEKLNKLNRSKVKASGNDGSFVPPPAAADEIITQSSKGPIAQKSKEANKVLPPMSEREKALYKRNGWRKNVRGDVMDKSPTNSKNEKICEGCATNIEGTKTQKTKNGDVQVPKADIDHNPTLETRVEKWREDVHIKGSEANSRKEILDDLNDTSKLRPLCTTCNRNHSIENVDGPFKNIENGVDTKTGESIEKIRERIN